MKQKQKPLSLLGFMACACAVLVAVAVLAGLMPPHWKEFFLRAFGILFLCFAGFMVAVGLHVRDDRKKKEHESRCLRVDDLRAKVEALEAEVEALHQRNTTAPPSAPGSWTGNAQEVDLRGVPGQWSAGRKVPAEGSRPVTGNAVELEINEGE